MTIAICGKSGAGKGTVCKILKEFSNDIVWVDIDKIGHSVNEKEEVKEKLVSNFGEGILTDGIVDRKKLGKRVFNSKEEMDLLGEITWHSMEEEIDYIISENKENVILLDWNLLPKTKYFKDADLRILVQAPSFDREERAMKRDKISRRQFMIRDINAPNYKDLDFDIVINNIVMELTRKKVRKIYDKSIISR